jgi:hypothetical protein
VVLNIYRLTRADDDYGVTIAMIVAAKDDQSARIVAGREENDRGSSRAFGWVDDQVTTVEHIGSTIDGVEPGVLMTKESAS